MPRLVCRATSKTVRKRWRARCSRPRAVTVRQPRTSPIWAGDRPSHSDSSRTSRSRAPRRLSASCTSVSAAAGGAGCSTTASNSRRCWRLGTTAARPPVIGDHPSGRRVQPHPGGVTFGQLVEPTPCGQEHVGGGVLRVARRASAPGAVRDDVLAMSGEQRVEAPPSLGCRLPSSSFTCPAGHHAFAYSLATPPPIPEGKGLMDNARSGSIERLVAEEHELWEREAAGNATDSRPAAPRRPQGLPRPVLGSPPPASRSAGGGEGPRGGAQARRPDVVENYEQ